VYVEGSLSTRNWDDDKGVTHYRTEVRINDMIILDSRGKYGAGGADAQGGEAVEDGGSSKSAEDLLDEMSDSGAEAPAEDGKSSKKSSGKSKKKEEDPLEDMPF
jgi:single-stranded DNA-binding protein